MKNSNFLTFQAVCNLRKRFYQICLAKFFQSNLPNATYQSKHLAAYAKRLLSGIPQGSLLGLLVFGI